MRGPSHVRPHAPAPLCLRYTRAPSGGERTAGCRPCGPSYYDLPSQGQVPYRIRSTGEPRGHSGGRAGLLTASCTWRRCVDLHNALHGAPAGFELLAPDRKLVRQD